MMKITECTSEFDAAPIWQEEGSDQHWLFLPKALFMAEPLKVWNGAARGKDVTARMCEKEGTELQCVVCSLTAAKGEGGYLGMLSDTRVSKWGRSLVSVVGSNSFLSRHFCLPCFCLTVSRLQLDCARIKTFLSMKGGRVSVLVQCNQVFVCRRGRSAKFFLS